MSATRSKSGRAVERNPNTLLINHIFVRAKDAGVPWDTYHADYLLGVITDWLDQHDAVLTGRGVKKVSRRTS